MDMARHIFRARLSWRIGAVAALALAMLTNPIQAQDVAQDDAAFDAWLLGGGGLEGSPAVLQQAVTVRELVEAARQGAQATTMGAQSSSVPASRQGATAGRMPAAGGAPSGAVVERVSSGVEVVEPMSGNPFDPGGRAMGAMRGPGGGS